MLGSSACEPVHPTTVCFKNLSLHDVSSHSFFAVFRATLHDLQQTMFQRILRCITSAQLYPIFLGLWNSIQTTYLLWQLLYMKEFQGTWMYWFQVWIAGSQERNHTRCLFSHVACERKNQWCSCSLWFNLWSIVAQLVEVEICTFQPYPLFCISYTSRFIQPTSSRQNSQKKSHGWPTLPVLNNGC